jgi:hypothetical protein
VPDRWFSSISVAVAVVSPTVTMQNEEGKMVDLYVPRKWYVCLIILYLESVSALHGWFCCVLRLSFCPFLLLQLGHQQDYHCQGPCLCADQHWPRGCQWPLRRSLHHVCSLWVCPCSGDSPGYAYCIVSIAHKIQSTECNAYMQLSTANVCFLSFILLAPDVVHSYGKLL